jgi:WD40 repeat protein
LTAACVLSAALVSLAAADNETKAPVAPSEKPRTDLHGDPLPEGALARLGTIRWRHASPVAFVAFTPDGKALVTASQHDTIRLWDVDSGKPIRTFERQPGQNAGRPLDAAAERLLMRQQLLLAGGYYGVVGIGFALSPDGKTLASSRPNDGIRLWEVATGKEARHIQGPPGNVGAPTFSPDSRTLVARGNDQSIYFWDAATGEQIRQIRAKQEPLAKGARVRLLGNINGPAALVFSPDGKTIANVESIVADRKIATALKFWDVETGKEIRQLDLKQPNGIYAVAYAPDGKTLAYGGRNAIYLVDPSTCKEIRQFQGQQPALASLVFSPDSKTLAVKGLTGSVVTLYDVETGKEVRKLYQSTQGLRQPVALNRYAASQRDVAFSPDGKLVALGGGSTVRLWDPATGKEIVKAGGHQGTITALAMSPDGKLAVSKGDHNTIRVWETRTGKQRHEFHGPPGTTTVAALSPDGKIVALAGGDNTIRVHEVATGKELHKLTSGQNGIAALAFSADAKTLASRGARENTIRLFDVTSGRDLRLISLPTQTLPAAPGQTVFIPAGGFGGSWSGLVFSPNGQTIAALGTINPLSSPYMPTSGSAGMPLFLMDVTTGKEVRRIELPFQPGVAGFAFSPDGRTVATENLDRTVSIWELASGKVRVQFGKTSPAGLQPGAGDAVMRIRGFVNSPLASTSPTLAFSPDGRTLTVKGQGGSVRVWDVITGKSLGGVKGHAGTVTALALAGEGKTLITGSSDTTILVWDLTRFQPEKQPQGELNSGDVEGLWAVLGGTDANLAFGAIHRLSTNSPDKVVPFLGGRLKPTPPVEAGKIDRLIRDLDSSKFRVRQQASEELEKLGELAEPALRKALGAQPSLESLRRVQRLLEKLAGAAPLSKDQIRLVRAVEVLEQIRTPEAQQVLRSLASGAPGALPTREAQAALERLASLNDRP